MKPIGDSSAHQPDGGPVSTVRTLESSIDIARPVEQVFPYVTTPGHWPQWSSPVIEVRSQREGQLGPDTTFTVVAKLVGRQFETECQVTDYEVDRLLGYTSASPPSTFSWRFEPVAGGTRVTQTVTADEAHAGRFFRLAFPLVEAAYRRQMAADLATLKDLVETQTREG
jgi:uncharacterized protein YndB with AHSA1/START domain